MPVRPHLSPAVKESLDRISADSLRGHLSFLASDLLEGRGTPSKGLDLAAEYIAAQFRRAGLEPIGDDGYFQTADWKYLAPDPDSFACQLKLDGQAIPIGEDHASGSLEGALDLPPTSTIKVDASNAAALKAARARPGEGEGRAGRGRPAPTRRIARGSREVNRARLAFLQRMDELKPALVSTSIATPTSVLVSAGRGRPPGRSVARVRAEDHAPLAAARQGLRRRCPPGRPPRR